MSLVAVPAKCGRWIDTNQGLALTDSVLDALIAHAIMGLFLYLPLPGNNPSNDLNPELLQRACGKGLQVSAIQHVRTGPHGLWIPSLHDGAADARHAADYAAGCLFPQRAHIGQDLEACHGHPQDVQAYTDAWGGACLQFSPYRHRLYIGYSTLLSPLQLYHLKTPDSYWSDAGHREVAVRGVDTEQGNAITIDGVKFDVDFVAPDRLGGMFLAAATFTGGISA